MLLSEGTKLLRVKYRVEKGNGRSDLIKSIILRIQIIAFRSVYPLDRTATCAIASIASLYAIMTF